MSRETRIGLLFAISLAVLIFGYKYLKGQNLFSSSQIFYVEYMNVAGLQPSNSIMKNGLQIGIVKDIYMKDNDPSKIIVELDVSGDIAIPKNAKAVITADGVMGGKLINLDYSTVCKGADCAQSGDFLKGKTKGLISSMIGDPIDAKQYIDVMKDGALEFVDSLGGKMDTTSEMGKTFASLQATMANLELATARLNNLLASSAGSLETTLTSFASLSSNLAESNAKITSIISNADEMVTGLNESDLGKTVGTATEALAEVKKVMVSADEAVKKLSLVMDKANSKEGTLGLLMSDTHLYENLNEASTSLTLLMSDFRVHPERYRRILSKKTKTPPLNEVPPEVKKGNK